MNKFKEERPRGYYTSIIIASILVLFALVWGLGKAMPFKPFDFDAYKVYPRTVCPGEPVEVAFFADIDSSYSTGLTYSGDAYWIYPPNGLPYDSTTIIPQPLQPTDGIEEFHSPVQRIAPLTPGEWHVGSTIRVDGKIFGLVPRQQVLTVQSNDFTMVKSYTDSSCFDREGMDNGRN